METIRKSIHPLVATAAIAVTAVSVLGAIVIVTNQVSAQHASPAAAPAALESSSAAPAARPGAAPLPPPTRSGSAPAGTAESPATAAATPCADCGVVLAVRSVRTAGNASGVGAVAGGVVGAVVGNQVGRGGGRTAARLLGALGGAVAGHEIEKQAKATTHFEIDVRMDDGSRRTVTSATSPQWQVGERIRVDNGQIRAVEHAPGPA